MARDEKIEETTDKLLSLIIQRESLAVKAEREKALLILTGEINLAHQGEVGGVTSRLTSAYMKISSPQEVTNSYQKISDMADEVARAINDCFFAPQDTKAERDSGDLEEGLWMGKKIKEMSRIEIIKAWHHTNELYLRQLKDTNR